MYKKLDNGVEINYPVNDRTAFRVEGYNDYFTIIDAITKVEGHETYLLLESNSYGEEFTLVIKLPDVMYKIIKLDESPMYVFLDKKQPYAIFIKERYVIADDCAGNYLTETLQDNNIINVEDEDSYIQWFSADINKMEGKDI